MDADLTARSAAGARGLAGHYVNSADIFDLESNRIFDCHWLCVARDGATANSKQLSADSRLKTSSLVLIQTEAGTIKAFRNFCRHRGSQLVNAENCGAMGKRIQCPYHAWTYDRSGRLVSAPNMVDVEDFRVEDHGLLEVACQTMAGFIWINFNPRQETFGMAATVERPFSELGY